MKWHFLISIYLLGLTLQETWAQECTDKEACLYFADPGREGVFSMPVGGGPHTRIPVPGGVESPVGVAFDPSTGTLFISILANTSYITKYSKDSTEKIDRYNLLANAKPYGLAVDPISQVVFYTDFENLLIGVVSTNLIFHKIVVNQSIKPLRITVDPMEGYIYWTDHNPPSIKKARMDGSDQQILAKASIERPMGIFLDVSGPEKYLYWCDSGHGTISRCKPDGSDRKEILSTTGNVNGIAVDSRYIYFTNTGIGAIQRVLKDGSQLSSEDLGTVYRNTYTFLKMITIQNYFSPKVPSCREDGWLKKSLVIPIAASVGGVTFISVVAMVGCICYLAKRRSNQVPETEYHTYSEAMDLDKFQSFTKHSSFDPSSGHRPLPEMPKTNSYSSHPVPPTIEHDCLEPSGSRFSQKLPKEMSEQGLKPQDTPGLLSGSAIDQTYLTAIDTDDLSPELEVTQGSSGEQDYIPMDGPTSPDIIE